MTKLPPHRTRWDRCGPLIVLPVMVLLFTPAAWPRWAFMWSLALSLYAGCKWLTWRTAPAAGVAYWRQASYLLLWPGMDAAAFFETTTLVVRPSAIEWSLALTNILMGGVFFFLLPRRLEMDSAYLTGWLGMIGMILMLHFGAIHIASCAWRTMGVDAQPLMKRPLASKSLGEFWGMRWNMAFLDLTYGYLFRPLARSIGPRWAIVVGLFISGLIHDLVISVPAGGGYGGPTAFFLLQAAGMLMERSRGGKALGLRNGLRGWANTMCMLAAPACMLFHPPFVLHVVVPLMQALGAI